MKRAKKLQAYELAEAGLVVLALSIGGFTMWFVNHSRQVADSAYSNAAKRCR